MYHNIRYYLNFHHFAIDAFEAKSICFTIALALFTSLSFVKVYGIESPRKPQDDFPPNESFDRQNVGSQTILLIYLSKILYLKLEEISL